MTDQAIAVREPGAMTLGALRYDDDDAMMVAAAHKARALKSVIEQTSGAVTIQGRQYVKVEGWTTLAALVGLVPTVVSVEEREDGSFLAVVELRTHTGHTLTRADSECGSEDDRPWNNRPRYARRSMAQTRATGKACRLALSWVMTLGGYAPTPYEEMPQDALDGEVVRNTDPQPTRVHRGKGERQVTQPQIKRLFAMLQSSGLRKVDIEMYILAQYGAESIDALTMSQYDEMIGSNNDFDGVRLWLAAQGAKTAEKSKDPDDDIPF